MRVLASGNEAKRSLTIYQAKQSVWALASELHRPKLLR